MHPVSALLDRLLPDTCLLCEQAVRPLHRTRLCEHCLDALPRNAPCCPGCALPFTGADLCGRCQRRPLVPGRCIVPLVHDELTQLLVHRLKFNKGMREARCLAALMSDAIHNCSASLPEALIPVPLAYVNEVRRGYNQSFELARHIGREFTIPVVAHAVGRVRGAAQRTLKRRDRAKLSASAFPIKRRIPFDHVAIVDDVMTTGSTVSALAAALTSAGVVQVDAWCATRALGV